MQGKIVKGIAGFYYVHVTDCGVYECKAKGIFRNKNIKPLVGDNVEIDIIDEVDFKGNIVDILPRNNELIRPAVANIDQSLVVFASLSPAPNFNLLSRFLCMMEYNEIPTVICFNKTDQIEDDKLQEIVKNFEGAGCRILMTSTVTGQGLSELREVLEGKTTALAGPSGVGKSSMLNAVYPDADVKTGEISEKINRGKHTTRHTEIFHIEGSTYVMDTPGFTSLDYSVLEDKELRFYFNEFSEHEGQCRFNGCVHVNEPGCSVKNAVSEGLISGLRYDIYLEMYNELKNKRKY
jgi:ribosome biogenesis GTPase